MRFQGKPFILFFLIIFCLTVLEVQAVFLHVRSLDTSLTPFPCQGHACGCEDADDCRNHCCCSKMPLTDAPLKPVVSCFVRALHCRGIHTDIPIGHLTQYEPLIDKITGYFLVYSGAVLIQKVQTPLEPYLSPPYRPPEYLPDTHFLA